MQILIIWVVFVTNGKLLAGVVLVVSQGNTIEFKIETRNQEFTKDNLMLECIQCGTFVIWYKLD